MGRVLVVVTALLFVGLEADAQAPTPVVVPAAVDVTPPPAAPATQKTEDEADLTAEIELLHELKGKNEETLKKQQALLEVLEQLQKDADQIRIFAKRG